MISTLDGSKNILLFASTSFLAPLSGNGNCFDPEPSSFVYHPIYPMDSNSTLFDFLAPKGDLLEPPSSSHHITSHQNTWLWSSPCSYSLGSREFVRRNERGEPIHSLARFRANLLDNHNWGNDSTNPQMEALSVFINWRSKEMVLFLSRKHGGKLGKA
jgi:hypothetical protein